jgi:RNA polymerase sigma-70 factor (ECF subfamily)
MFLATRSRLFAIAYRMLGSVSDAEDILQDCFLRWQSVEQSEVRDPVGYLLRITSRLCLDQLKSARVRREEYPGEWLPEPILTDEPLDGLDHDVSVALLMALERLSPAERAAFLLHDVFDTPFAEISDLLDRSAASCRQLATRARKKVQDGKPKTPVAPGQSQALTEAFFRAAKAGDLDSLKHMLADDVQLISDGGGKAMAALNPIFGAAKVLRLLDGLARKYPDHSPTATRQCHLNGLPAMLSLEPEGILQATALEIEAGRISRIYVIRNPDKTRHLLSALNGDDLPKNEISPRIGG